MATAIKKCRVCGKEYESCRSAKRGISGVFRWQEVACSAECGAEYLALIASSRNLSEDKYEYDYDIDYTDGSESMFEQDFDYSEEDADIEL